mgnify:CR=1 FL=1
MKVTIESKKGLKTNLKIFVEKKIIEGKISDRLTELSKTVNLKGFRPGKVPPDVLKRQFGQAVYGEVLEKILKETSSKAIEDKKIRVAGQPKLDLKSYGEGKDLNYTLEVNELPTIKLKNLDKVKFTSYEIKVSDVEIEKRISEIAKNQNNYKNKEDNKAAENGDLVVFDYEATIENKSFEGNKGKDIQIVLGKDLFIKGFDKQLLGLKKKEEKFVNVVLPENYPKKEYANKEAKFNCKILNIKKVEPVKIDDEFAKNLGAKDLKNLRDLISKQVQNQYSMSLEALSKESILEQIEKEHNLELPENMVQEELKIISQNLKKDESEKNKKESEKIAKKRIKLGLILNEIGENNNLKVTEEELKNEINKQIQSMPGQQKQVLEYYKNNPSATISLKGAIYEEKVINLIKSKSTESKKIITTIEADQILKNDFNNKKQLQSTLKKDEVKKPKKSAKSLKTNKKIRKK